MTSPDAEAKRWLLSSHKNFTGLAGLADASCILFDFLEMPRMMLLLLWYLSGFPMCQILPILVLVVF